MSGSWPSASGGPIAQNPRTERETIAQHAAGVAVHVLRSKRAVIDFLHGVPAGDVDPTPG